MANANDNSRYLANLQKEIDGSFLYHALADSEKQQKLSELYRRLAASEEKHASAWESRLRDAGVSFAPVKPSVARQNPGFPGEAFRTSIRTSHDNK